MLYDTGSNTFKDLFVFLEILVEVLDTDLIRTYDIFIHIGQAEATFPERHLITEGLDEFGIDEHLLEILGSRIIGIERIAIDNK